jgi:hypothetical protein
MVPWINASLDPEVIEIEKARPAMSAWAIGSALFAQAIRPFRLLHRHLISRLLQSRKLILQAMDGSRRTRWASHQRTSVPLRSPLYTCPPIASVIVLLLPTMNGGLSGTLRDLLREALLALVCPALSSCRRFHPRCTTTRRPLITLGATIRKLFSRIGRDPMLVIIFAGIASMISGSLERMWQVIRPWCTIDDYLSVLMHQSTVTFEV